jgi:hypothetical protein
MISLNSAHLRVTFLAASLPGPYSMPVHSSTPARITTTISNTKLDSDIDCAGVAQRFSGSESKNVILIFADHSPRIVGGSAIFASAVAGIIGKNGTLSASGHSSKQIELTNRTSK